MSFFGDLSDETLVEEHAREVLKLQTDEARDLLKQYSEARKDLQDRLIRAPIDRFTAQHLRGALVQVNAGITAMTKALEGDTSEGALKAAMRGVEHLLKEIKRFSQRFGGVQPIHINAIKVALNTREFLINKYDASLKAYDQDVRRKITNALTQAAIEELPYSEVVKKVGVAFQGEEWKLQQIVRTELHHVYSLGKLNGMKEAKKDQIPDLKKALFHKMDSRTGEDSVELATENPILPLDEPFRQTYRASPKSKVQNFVFMVPPNRPNDRAILVPYRDEWDRD